MVRKRTSTKAVTKTKAKAPANYDARRYGAKHQERYDTKELQTAFLGIIEQLSPELKKKDARYHKDAKEGCIINKATRAVFDNAYFVPIFKERTYIEWVPRKRGGGFVKDWTWAGGQGLIENGQAEKMSKDDNFFTIKKSKNQLIETHYRYGFLLNSIDGNSTAEAVIIPMTSARLRSARALNTALNHIVFHDDQGPFKPAPYQCVFKLGTLQVDGKENDYYIWDFTYECPTAEIPHGIDIIEKAATVYDAFLQRGFVAKSMGSDDADTDDDDNGNY